MTLPVNVPQAGVQIVGADGRLTREGYRLFTSIQTFSGTTDGALAAAFLLASASSDLPGARTFAAGTALSAVDGGAGGALTVNLDDTAVSPGSYGAADRTLSATVDQQGRLTAIASALIAIAATQISDSTAAGRDMLKAASVAAQRALLGVTTSSSGTYTPTLTNGANVAASTAYVCQWLRVGDMVTVSGIVDVDPTAGATGTALGISLPVASAFTAPEQCAGTAAGSAVAGEAAAIRGDTVNDRAEMVWVTADASNHAMYLQFSYQVL